MMGFTVYSIGWSYAHLHHSHIRIDIFYSKMSPRGKAYVDVLFFLFAFFPLIGLLLYKAIEKAWVAWAIKEVVLWSAWYPPAGPYKTVFAFGCFLFLLQGVSQLVKDIKVIRGVEIE